ncbi:MAG: lipid-A-disaccharide synthase [Desulforhopalus sp.]
MSPTIMIVAGEASGDLHGANLVRALYSSRPDLHFCGMGGPDLSSAGVDILYDASKVSVVGVFEVVSHLKDIFLAQRILRTCMEEVRPDLLILIDLPDFNLMLAGKARKLGIPVFYYISPQVWAWRKGRVKTLRERVDKMGVILPFEEDFFLKHNVQAQYVGHPLLDSVEVTCTRDDFCKAHSIAPEQKCIGLLPGSRKREVAALLPIFFSAAELMQHNHVERLVFIIPKAATVDNSVFEGTGLGRYQKILDIRVIEDDRYNLMAACDAVVAASGTVTLELAILGIPMIVVYRLSRLSYLLGRLLVKLDYFSLVNLIAGYEAVPELLQDEVVPERIVSQLDAIISQPEERLKMEAALAEVRAKLGGSGASAKAAAAALQLLEEYSCDR